MAIEMVTGSKTIQNTWPLVSISNRTRDINSWKIGFSHWAFWNILIMRIIVRVMSLFFNAQKGMLEYTHLWMYKKQITFIYMITEKKNSLRFQGILS